MTHVASPLARQQGQGHEGTEKEKHVQRRFNDSRRFFQILQVEWEVTVEVLSGTARRSTDDARKFRPLFCRRHEEVGRFLVVTVNDELSIMAMAVEVKNTRGHEFRKFHTDRLEEGFSNECARVSRETDSQIGASRKEVAPTFVRDQQLRAMEVKMQEAINAMKFFAGWPSDEYNQDSQETELKVDNSHSMIFGDEEDSDEGR